MVFYLVIVIWSLVIIGSLDLYYFTAAFTSSTISWLLKEEMIFSRPSFL